jgi:hypothetical protein
MVVSESKDFYLGLHGSAFVNMIFMKPLSHVLELSNSSYDPFHDFFLARQLGIQFIRLCSHTNSSHSRSIHQSFDDNIRMIERSLASLSKLLLT